LFFVLYGGLLKICSCTVDELRLKCVAVDAELIFENSLRDSLSLLNAARTLARKIDSKEQLVRRVFFDAYAVDKIVSEDIV
jgi:hypothetical protein